MFKHVLITVAITGLIAVALPVEASAAKAGAAGRNSLQGSCEARVSQRP